MEITCKVCGKTEDPSHWSNRDVLTKHQMCFNCNFWREQHEADQSGRRRYAIVDGVHYVLDRDDVDTYFKGYGGRKFVFKYNSDGKIVECRNVWCQGDIPEGYWRNLMPDNAQIIQ